MVIGVKVKFSERSQELIKEYLEACRPNFSSLESLSSSMDLEQLVAWLDSEITTPAYASIKSKKEIEFILASLRAELLRDLFTSLGGDNSNIKKSDINPTWTDKLKFALLAIAGTLYAACEGFDSITTMMGVLSLPSLVILIGGIFFSVLSVLVFYGFDLVQVSKNLGIKLSDAPKLLDVYVVQLDEIKAIRRKIDTYSLAHLSPDELAQIENTLLMLQKRFSALIQASQQFDLALNSKKMQMAKGVIAFGAGILFFGGGFYAGQSVALFILGLFITSVTPSFWPVVLFSCLIGLAAFSLYWFIYRVEVKKLISGWFGLDEDKIVKLCNKDDLAKEENKLANLKEKVVGIHALVSQIVGLKQINIYDEDKVKAKVIEASAVIDDHFSDSRISSNIYSFHSNASNRVNCHLDSEHYDAVSGCGNR